MKKNLLLLLLLILSSQSVLKAQTCASTSRNPWEWPGHKNWFVGQFSTSATEKGFLIDFNAGFNVTEVGGAGNGITVYEGVTAASNDQGQIQLFSNGRNLWNSTAAKISTGLLEGNEGGATGERGSASQGVITVRHPLVPHLYYVVTVGDVIGGGNPQMSYNVFNEQDGTVTGATSLGINTTEAITATLHENGVDVWVITHQYGGNNIYAHLLTCNGFINPPVITSIGPNVVGNEGRGGMAMSWDGLKMAMNYGGAGANVNRQLMIYDFDKEAGTFSNRMDIVPGGVSIGSYDVIFSKDNSKVYVAGYSAFTGAVVGFDISSGNEATIRTTYNSNVLGLTAFPYFHSIEYGPDGNLYVNGQDGLYRWNGAGNAVKVAGAIGNSTGQGLPTMYIPPAEEPITTPVGPFCDTDGPVNLQTVWMCSGLNAEDTLNLPASVYSGPGILFSGEGIFDPGTAGVGVHPIIFTKCAVDDTIYIEVTSCQNCIDSLKNITPEICAGTTVLLDTFLVQANGPGVWTVAEAPAGTGTAGSISINGTDTSFNASAANTIPGRYKLMYTVTNAGQTCKDSIYVIVNRNPVATVNNDTICVGDPAATFTATADSVIASYLWSENGLGTLPSTTGITAGNYTVVVTDGNTCKDTATGVLRVNALPIALVNNDTICFGDAAATFTATADSAITDYLWSVNGTGTASTTTGTTAGDYTVIVTDVHGCKDTATGVLRVNAKPIVEVNNDTICFGDAAATFTATADSAISDYLWSVNGTGTASTTTGTTAGDYTVIVTDVHGCKDTATGVLTVNAKPISEVNNDTICFGDAAATFTATADSAITDYLWSVNGTGTASTTTGTTAGDYTVIVTDVHGCKDTATGVLRVNAKPIVEVDSDTICFGDPVATLTATVDSSVFSYTWSDIGTGTAASTPASAAGNYTVEIVDVNGCKDTTTAVLTVSAKPVITLINDTICMGETGTFTAAVDSAVTSYLWSINGTGTAATTTGTTVGDYTLEIVDVNGCKDTATAQLIVNAKPVVEVNNDTICAGDTPVVFTATSDSTVADYLWSVNGTGTAATTTGTTPGDYTVEIIDVHGCKDTATGILTVNALPVVSVADQVICAGGAVTATFTAVSDSTPDTYAWSDNGTGTAVTTTGNTAGGYTVEVTDVNGCIATGTGQLRLSALPVVTVNDAAICAGDAAVVFTVTSDSTAASYIWSDNGTGTAATTSGNTAGDYTVEVTDVNGCVGSGTGVLTVNSLPTVSIESTSVCPGASQTITPVVTGGQAPFTYLWSTGETTTTIDGGAGGNFTVTVTDANTCEGSDDATITINNNLNVVIDGPVDLCAGEDTLLVSNYKAADGYTFIWTNNGATVSTDESYLANATGTYNLDVDRSGCAGTGTVDVTVHALPTVTVNSEAICAGDAAETFTATSATAVSYIWSDNGTGTAQTTTGLSSGDYTVEVTDNFGCKATGTGVLTVNALPTVTVNSEAICAGDAAETFSATSATAVSYVWSDQGTGTAQTTTGTTAGNYSVEVTDANNCTASATGVLTVNAVPTVSVNSPEICEGETATLTATSATATSYVWSGSGSGTTASISGTVDGSYIVVVTDANNCTATSTGVLTVNPLPVPGNDPASVCDGLAATVGENMGAGYTYEWVGIAGETNFSYSTTTQGTYTRRVTSSDNCSATSNYIVTVNSNPIVNVADATECEGIPITLQDPNLASGYTYSWSNGATTAFIQPTVSGVYTLTATNTATNCFGSDQATVTIIPIPVVDLGADQTICEGDQVVLDAGNPSLTKLWNTRETTTQITASDSSTYFVDVFDGSCTSSDTVKVHVVQYPVSQLDKRIEDQLICFEEIDSALILNAGNSTYNYLWNTGDTTNQITASAEGTYFVTISAGSCSIEDQVTLTAYCPWTLYVPNAITLDGDGLNDRFYAYGTNIIEFEMVVLDRWGLKIFESNDINIGWDGTYKGSPVQQDVYVWKVKFSVETEGGSLDDHFKVGTVTVVR